jgi:hypothetical protein
VAQHGTSAAAQCSFDQMIISDVPMFLELTAFLT